MPDWSIVGSPVALARVMRAEIVEVENFEAFDMIDDLECYL